MMKKTISFSTNTNTEYVINGVKYKSLDEMPANVRANYEHLFKDTDGNGIPDIVETPGDNLTSVRTHNKYIINGREYDSLDSMPPDVRKMYEMLVTDKDKNGIPDIQTPGFVDLDSIDTDVIEGAMKELSGKYAPNKYNDIKTIRNDVIGIYKHRQDSVFQNKVFWVVVFLILFIVVFSLS